MTHSHSQFTQSDILTYYHNIIFSQSCLLHPQSICVHIRLKWLAQKISHARLGHVLLLTDLAPRPFQLIIRYVGISVCGLCGLWIVECGLCGMSPPLARKELKILCPHNLFLFEFICSAVPSTV